MWRTLWLCMRRIWVICYGRWGCGGMAAFNVQHAEAQLLDLELLQQLGDQLRVPTWPALAHGLDIG